MYNTSYDSLFSDKRLEKRGEQLLSSLFRAGFGSIQSISESRAEQKGYYRLLRNEKVSETILIDEMTKRCGNICKDKVVLAIQDSSEINLSHHRRRIKQDESIGPIQDHFDGIGFHIHPSLVIDAFTCYPYGYSAIDVWSRKYQKQTLSAYAHRRLDVCNKRTNVWLESNKATYKSLQQAKAVIIVQDREDDFYEQFASAPQDGKFYLLVRSNHNRLLEDGIKLWDYIDGQPVIGSYKTIISTQQKGKPAVSREALIEVKTGSVVLKKPQQKNVHMPCSSVALTVVEAREVNAGDGNEPVLWRLYTTFSVENFEQACRLIAWYSCRWMIEEVFKVLKKECYDIEASELESGWAIRKLTLMMLDTIIKLFQMSVAYNTPEGEIPDTITMFDEQEIQCLEHVNKKVQGKTEKLSNPFNKAKLVWAFWILARLGGWKGYASQRKPGFATLIKGLKQFYAVYQGFTLEKDVGTQ